MEQQMTSGSASMQEIQAIHNAPITSTEVACLWATFQEYTMLNCVFGHFERTVQDRAARQIITDLMPRFGERIGFAAHVLQNEGIPIPMGFTQQDVNLSAPPLYSDVFFLHFLRNLVRTNMTLYTLNLNVASRPDIRDFYAGVVQAIIDINTRVSDLMLSKGILPRPPHVTLALEIERVGEPRFMAGFLGEKRPLLTIELAHLYNNALSNEVGWALLLGFRQVSRHREVHDYFAKGMQLAGDIVQEIHRLTRNEEIYLSLLRDEDITASTEAPFSERLMMFMTSLLNSIGIGMFGVSMGISMRRDLTAMYAKYMAEIGSYAGEGLKLMMANDWLEEPPQVLDREKLAVYKH